MRLTAKSVSVLVAAIAAGTSIAYGQGEPTPVDTGADEGAGSGSAVEAPASPPPPTLTEEELLARSQEAAERIEIWDERPEKPFDRDTEIRLTGEQLAQRGATDLATALALLPDVSVRDGGRGGFNIDVRGARKGAVRVLIDGVAVSDPFYGTFDVSTIPVTDIVQIRVSTAPASPIDGPGGPGGVIEVHTRDAIGARLVVARLTSDTLPTFGASATGRVALVERVALRLSASSIYGMHDYETALPDVTVDNRRRAVTGTLRVEYRHGGRRAVLDGFVDNRRYLSPPSDELMNALFLLIDRETTGRVGAGYEDELGADRKLQVQTRAWVHAMKRISRNFMDPELTDQNNAEDLFAMRAGAMALATRPIGKLARWVGSVTVDHERARVETDMGFGGVVVTKGDATVVEAAGGGQVEWGPLKGDAAAGVALPAGIDADPWPEAKLSVTYRPVALVELEAIGARKGRVPSLRERFQGSAANESLDPEMAWHGELRTTVRPHEGIEIVAAPYFRRTTGTVRLDAGGSGLLINLGNLDVRGVDTSVKARVHRTLELGGAYIYARAESDDVGLDPLDRFPKHRADGWVKVTPVGQIIGLVRARYAGRALDQSVTTPAYVLWEASVTAMLGGDWLAVARCDDILDVRPETRSGYHLPGRVISLIVQGTWE